MKHWRKVVGLGFALCGLPAVLGPDRDPATGEPYRYLPRPYSYTDQRNKSFLSLKPERIGIIGGHLAGCVAAKTMLQQGFKVQVLEKKLYFGEDTEPGMWALPDCPGTVEAKDEFLRRYIDQFSLHGSILMGCEAQSIAQQSNGTWTVSTAHGQLTFDFLIVAAGFRRVPTPRFANSHRYTGLIYANESPPYANLAGKDVVVIGPQDTAVDEIVQLCEAGAKVVYVFPKGDSLKNRSRVTDWLQGTRVGDVQVDGGMNKTVGGSFRAGVDSVLTYFHNIGLPKEVQVQSYGKSRLATSSVFDFTPYLSSKQLTIVRGSVSNAEDDLLFVDLRKVHCDAVVLTPTLVPNCFGLLQDGSPGLYRGAIKPGVRNLAFLGLYNGPMKPVLVNLQGKWLLDVLRGRVLLPSQEFIKSRSWGEEGYQLADVLLDDCGIGKYRRATWAREWLQQMKAEDYREVVTHSR